MKNREEKSQIQQLMDLINSGSTVSCGHGCMHGSGIPIGRVANDIADIYKENRCKESEQALLDLLGHEQPSARFVSFCCLKQLATDPTIISKLDEFAADPLNKDIVSDAHRQFGITA